MPNPKQLTDIQQLLGKRVSALRESLELSQEEFSEKCGWDRARQSKIESGQYNLTLASLLSIANVAKMRFDINFTKS